MNTHKKDISFPWQSFRHSQLGFPSPNCPSSKAHPLQPGRQPVPFAPLLTRACPAHGQCETSALALPEQPPFAPVREKGDGAQGLEDRQARNTASGNGDPRSPALPCPQPGAEGSPRPARGGSAAGNGSSAPAEGPRPALRPPPLRPPAAAVKANPPGVQPAGPVLRGKRGPPGL